MRKKRLGALEVGAQGLGCMNLTGYYSRPFDETLSIATVHEFIDQGGTLLDTADIYGPHTNEELVGRAIRDRRDKAVLSTKFGAVGADRPVDERFRGDPAYVREACEGSLRRLGIETIDLYFCHRVDRRVPVEETVGAMSDLVREGKIRHLGMSEASADTLRRACAVHPIAAIENEWSLWTRDIEDEGLAVARKLGIGIIPYAPLGRGFLTGQITSEDDFSLGDFRRGTPRFSGENFHKNLDLVSKVKEIAADRGVTPAQLALAWLDARGPDVVPIPGSDRPEFVRENVGALDITLTDEELAAIEAVLPRDSVAGTRYEAMDEWVGLSTPPRT